MRAYLRSPTFLGIVAVSVLVAVGIVDHTWQMLVIGLAVGFSYGRLWQVTHDDNRERETAVAHMRMFLAWAQDHRGDLDDDERDRLDAQVREIEGLLLIADPPKTQRRWLRR